MVTCAIAVFAILSCLTPEGGLILGLSGKLHLTFLSTCFDVLQLALSCLHIICNDWHSSMTNYLTPPVHSTVPIPNGA